MNKEEYIKREEGAMLHTYNRFPVVLEKGEGVYLYDTDGKKYLDFAAGIAVEALGYGNRKYNDALKDQIDKLMHTSNLYYNLPIMEAAKNLKSIQDGQSLFYQQRNRGDRGCDQGGKKVCLYQRRPYGS